MKIFRIQLTGHSKLYLEYIDNFIICAFILYGLSLVSEKNKNKSKATSAVHAQFMFPYMALAWNFCFRV